MSKHPEPELGQEWRDCDKRMHGRTCKVVGFVGDGADRRALMQAKHSGEPTRVLVRRMYPHSTGWELVK